MLHYNLLFRWFLDLNLTDKIWDNSSFTTKQQRRLEHDPARLFFHTVVGQAEAQGWMSDTHFTADGTLAGAGASLKSFAPPSRGRRRKRTTNLATQRGLQGSEAEQRDAPEHVRSRGVAVQEGGGPGSAAVLRPAGAHGEPARPARHLLVSSATEQTETGAACELLAQPQDFGARRPQTVGGGQGLPQPGVRALLPGAWDRAARGRACG
jgi:hypothetical protein